eukprot:scaffold161033_cov17-Tisochrysis_lutea.AAC.1
MEKEGHKALGVDIWEGTASTKPHLLTQYNICYDDDGGGRGGGGGDSWNVKSHTIATATLMSACPAAWRIVTKRGVVYAERQTAPVKRPCALRKNSLVSKPAR